MLKLTPNGIFPITFDKEGKPLEESPQTGYTFPGTIQGEGKLAGVPSLFLRTSGCNLACRWSLPNYEISHCDSPESSIDIQEQLKLEVDEAFAIIKNNIGDLKHFVITGGEPVLQADALLPLAEKLKKELQLHLTLETNATIFHPELFAQMDLISLSPKLSTALGGKASASHQERTQATIKEVVELRQKGIDFQLKFVFSSPRDIDEIKVMIESIEGINNDDILLMPLGGDGVELDQTSQLTTLLAVENGWRYCPRLHIDIWGNSTGV